MSFQSGFDDKIVLYKSPQELSTLHMRQVDTSLGASTKEQHGDLQWSVHHPVHPSELTASIVSKRNWAVTAHHADSWNVYSQKASLWVGVWCSVGNWAKSWLGHFLCEWTHLCMTKTHNFWVSWWTPVFCQTPTLCHCGPFQYFSRHSAWQVLERLIRLPYQL